MIKFVIKVIQKLLGAVAVTFISHTERAWMCYLRWKLLNVCIYDINSNIQEQTVIK